MNPKKRYNDFNSYLKSLFGCRVQKITIDAGMDCPNRDGTLSFGGCVFCNEKGSGTGAHNQGLSVTRQIEAGKEALGRRYKAEKFISYFQAHTNTYAPIEHLAALYEESLAVPGVVGLSIGTRPDCVSPEIIDLLSSYARNHLVWIEYGLQSARDETLARINRGHDFRAFENAVAMTAERSRRKIHICAHVILGLPGENHSHMMETAEKLAATEIDGVKIHLLYVVKNTPLAVWYEKGIFRCMTREHYADTVCAFLARLPADVVIQRLTGDPRPDELIAPAWAIGKTETLKRIQAVMEEKDICQGDARKISPGHAPKRDILHSR